METSNSNPTNQSSSNSLADYQIIARIAGKFLLLSSIIVNTRREDSFLIGAAIISLYGNLLLIKAALRESEVQQIAPGQTTILNKLKVIGTTGNILSSLLLFYVLVSELRLGNPPTVAGQTSSASAVGALTI